MVKQGSIYSRHPGFKMVESSAGNLRARTGLGIEEWVEKLRSEGPEEEKAQIVWLKGEHGITTNYASWIVEEAAGRRPDAYDPDANVEAQYAGRKEALRPIYDALLRLGLSLGEDVTACPCGTFVPLFRKHVFAQIKPTTNTRIDLGLSLRGAVSLGRLIDTGGEAKGDRITHRIAIASVDEIDDEVRDWINEAYHRAAPASAK